MRLQSADTKFKNKWGNSIIKKVLYFTKYGIRSGKAHQGPKECQRRVRQGMNGMCYVHGKQYHD